MSVMTGWPERASKVSGAMKRRAERVKTTCTETPAFCRPRSTSTALYAAMQPVTPSATFTATS